MDVFTQNGCSRWIMYRIVVRFTATPELIKAHDGNASVLRGAPFMCHDYRR